MRGLQSVHYAVMLVAGTTLLSFACQALDESAVTTRKRGASSGENEEESGGDPSDPGGYDPQSPTNNGPSINTTGYAAIAPLIQKRCGECHHAGTAIALEEGADAITAAKIIATIEGGSMPPAPRDRVTADELAQIKAWRDGGIPTAQVDDSDPPNIPVTQIVEASTLASYKAALPKVAYGRLAKILASPSTLFYDKRVMPGAYQDTVDSTRGARFNNSGAGLIVPQGRKLFSRDGQSWQFPFGHTAGADDAPNTVIANFISLPAQRGALLPVAYKIENTSQGGFPNSRWTWSFPKGTVIGEIIMIRDGGNLVTAEIRTRERFADRWATNSFRPFPTAGTLAAALKEKSPGSPAIAALENNATLQAKRLDSPAFNNLVVLEGSVDAPLPDLDESVARDLLKNTPFVASYGTAWKINGAQHAFGATGPTSPRLSVVPSRFENGLFEVRETTCDKCHNQGGYFIGDLVGAAVLYGDLWGVDRIFSFYVFDPTRIDSSGNENRTARPAFTQAGIIAPYDASKHPSSLYTFYKTPR